jgi:N4-gp56 family major capsid protein
MSTGITNIFNMAPELPLQVTEDLLSTPQFNLIHSFGADLHYTQAHLGKVTRMMRYERLNTDGGYLDGSGVDPAPEVPVRTDVDAKTEIYAKVIRVNEQVVLFENPKVLTKFTALLGQWLREKEDLLMRDLYASSVSYINATGGTNGQQPSEITRGDVNNIERILLGNDARTLMESVEAERNIGTTGVRDAFIALASTDITTDLQNVSGVTMKKDYPTQTGLRPEEYCAISRFRFFVCSRGTKVPNASSPGAQTVFRVPMFGIEAASKIYQNQYTAKVGFRPDWVVSSAAQNCELYAKFAIAREITNQNWVSGLNVTQKL